MLVFTEIYPSHGKTTFGPILTFISHIQKNGSQTMGRHIWKNPGNAKKSTIFTAQGVKSERLVQLNWEFL